MNDTHGAVCEHAENRGKKLPKGIGTFLLLLAVLTASPFLYLLELAYIGASPLQARLWSPDSDRFGDFWHYDRLMGSLHKAEFFRASDRFAYPAPCAILYQGLYHLGSRPHLIYNLSLWITQGVSGVLLLFALWRRNSPVWKTVGLVSLITISSYPWHVLYDRANIELFVYMLVAGGVWAWLEGYEELAAVLWGTAGAMKIYPLLLLAVFTQRGTLRQFLLGAVTCVSVLLFSFWYVGPTMEAAAIGTMWGVRGFVGSYGAHTRFGELFLDHSLLGGMKVLLTLPFPRLESQILLSHTYEAVVLVLAPIAFVRWRKTAPAKNRLCLLLIGMMLLPPVSYDYTLIYAYLVFGIVLCDFYSVAKRGEVYPGWATYVVAFALIFTAENWMNILGFPPNGLLKTCSLVALAVRIVRHPIREEFAAPRISVRAKASILQTA